VKPADGHTAGIEEAGGNVAAADVKYQNLSAAVLRQERLAGNVHIIRWRIV